MSFSGVAVTAGQIKVMTDAIAHRGPDGEGQWAYANVGLGHRRLAILDPSEAGRQPMVSDDQRYVLSYNGEIYNFRELRVELERLGHAFRSDSDTEVLLVAFSHWGLKALNRLNGMFAFAVLDRKTMSLSLARDRYGIKPLYYYAGRGTFAFGSEQKAIIALPSVDRTLDREALLEYFTFQNIFTDRTLLKDIRMLPAGHSLTIDLKASQLFITPVMYWDYSFEEAKEKISSEECDEELDRLFVQAVKRQLVSDVEVGGYLSGGVDSGSIIATASRSLPGMKTFTCGFDLSSASGLELNYDERVAAEAMSYQFNTEHYQMVLKAGDMERSLESLAWHLEEPRIGQSYPNYYAAKLASKFVKVVLSGSGGDELFGGYPWRYYRGMESESFESYIDNYYLYWQRLVNNSQVKKMFAPIWKDVEHVRTRDIFKGVFETPGEGPFSPEDYVNKSLYFEAKTFLHGLFVVEDKLSMAHGLESRVPFMDNDLVEFAMTCPVRQKVELIDEPYRFDENETGNKPDRYYLKTSDGKRTLRRVMSRYVPTEVAERKKQGFSAPDASWFKGDSIDFVKSSLLNGDPAIYEYFDADQVRELVSDHIEGRKNRRLLIWSFLSVESYIQQFIS